LTAGQFESKAIPDQGILRAGHFESGAIQEQGNLSSSKVQ